MRIEGQGPVLREALVHAMPGRRIVQIDTRMSQVLLWGPHAIKLRRPMGRLGSALARRQALEIELRCNQQFSPTVYVGIFALPAPAGSAPPLPGWPVAADGEAPLDWALVMQRLPAARLLDRAIRRGTVWGEDIDRVAVRLEGLYREAPAARRSAAAHRAHIEREQVRNRSQLLALGAQLWPGRAWARERLGLEALLDRCEALWRAHRSDVAARVRQGCIVEAHGDLRPEHICLTEPIELIDCLEFNRQLRLLDPWEELCLLGLLCALAGAAWIGPRLADRIAAAGVLQAPSAGLLACYGAHHALVRARLAASHLADPHAPRAAHWRALTRRYLGYAQAACAGWHPLGSMR